GQPQRGVDSAKNDVFWQNANFDFCKKSKFICSRRKKRGGGRFPGKPRGRSGIPWYRPPEGLSALRFY
ncbi:hypothetical protein, partial [uncultured Bilophila sp.]|uniref:hypothetical protein n=1 Tax=uncultured Bilophila sp. TaxID=529385 RepID=UPI002602B2CC